MYIKFNKTIGDITKDYLYPIEQMSDQGDIVIYYFTDNKNITSIVKHLKGEKSDFFELVLT